MVSALPLPDSGRLAHRDVEPVPDVDGGDRKDQVDGAMAVAVVFGGRLRIVLRLSIAGDRIADVEAVADAERIGAFEVEVLEA